MKHAIVSRIDDGPFRYQAWPTVAKAKAATRPHYKIRTPLALGMRTFWQEGPKESLERRSIVRVSRDNGQTWSKDVCISTTPPDWDHGYPSSVELADGDIFTVYYQKCPGDDYNSLHFVRYSLEELA